MATAHLHRFLAIVPAGRIAAFNNFIRTSGIDPSGADWLRLSLSPIAGGAVNHAWFSTGLTNAELKKIVNRLCAITVPAITFPPLGWDDWTRSQKKTWMLLQRTTIHLSTGIWFSISDNDGDWDNADAQLQTLNLQRQAA